MSIDEKCRGCKYRGFANEFCNNCEDYDSYVSDGAAELAALRDEIQQMRRDDLRKQVQLHKAEERAEKAKAELEKARVAPDRWIVACGFMIATLERLNTDEEMSKATRRYLAQQGLESRPLKTGSRPAEKEKP